MTDRELGTQLGKLILEERKITNEILALISMAMSRRSYLELGFSSMFDWLVKGFGYSSSAAFRRIEAARLLSSVPEAAEKLEAGKINLSTLSRAQSVMRQQEKISGRKISNEKKLEIVEAIQNQSTFEAEKTLLTHFPEVTPIELREKQTVISDHQIRHQMNLSNEASADLKRAKEILSHIMPTATDGEVVAYALKFLLTKKDPLRKPINAKKSQAVADGEPSLKNTSTKEKAVKEFKTVKMEEEVKSLAQKAKLTSAAAVKMITQPRFQAQSRSKDEPRSQSQSKFKPPSNLKLHNQYQSLALLRREVFHQEKGQCSFKDPLTGRVCGSRFQVEMDHVRPRALGGDDSFENLRLLCRQHNFRAAEGFFGKEKMRQFRNGGDS